MDRELTRRVEDYRRNEAGPLENNLIDELLAGEMDRTEFLRRGAMFGLSVGAMGSLLAFAGEAGAATTTKARYASAKKGGTIRVGIAAFGASLEPYLLNEGGSLAFAGIPGEYLTYTNPQGQLVPVLATSWKPNADATVWTFQIRKGVKFHNGQTMTAKDVVASMKQYVGNKASNAGLSPFFDAAGVSAKGNYTVVFKLKSPIGVFPYLLSQTTYQAIIQPASIAANPGTWVKSGMIGTGAFKVTNYVDKKSATLVRNPSYWGGPAPMDGVKITFYQGSAPMVLALRAGQIDLAMQLSPQEGAPFKGNSKYKYYALPTSAHRQVCMRTDTGVLKDPRVRRAVALVDQSAAAAGEGHARGRSGRQRQPVLEGLRVDRQVDQAAHPEPHAREVAAGRCRVRRTSSSTSPRGSSSTTRTTRRRSRPTRSRPGSTSASRSWTSASTTTPSRPGRTTPPRRRG